MTTTDYVTKLDAVQSLLRHRCGIDSNVEHTGGGCFVLWVGEPTYPDTYGENSQSPVGVDGETICSYRSNPDGFILTDNVANMTATDIAEYVNALMAEGERT